MKSMVRGGPDRLWEGSHHTVPIVERFLPLLDRQKDVDALRLSVSAESLGDVQLRPDHSEEGMAALSDHEPLLNEPATHNFSVLDTESEGRASMRSGMSSSSVSFVAMDDDFQTPPRCSGSCVKGAAARRIFFFRDGENCSCLSHTPSTCHTCTTLVFSHSRTLSYDVRTAHCLVGA